MSLFFEHQTGLVSVQGLPTRGLRRFGVPPGGPFDTESAGMANALLGNDPEATVLELALVNARVTVSDDTMVSLVGGGHEAELDGIKVPLRSRFCLRRGATLLLRPVARGLRCYLALSGGVRAGDLANVFDPVAPLGALEPIDFPEAPRSLSTEPLRVISRGDLPFRNATVTARIDRVGLRLEAPGLATGKQSELSRPVVMGAIQRAPSGEILIHGPDGPTIGGYELLGVVARADLDRLGQLRPGQGVEFVDVSLEIARQLFESASADREPRLDWMRRAARSGAGP